jgi:hypothetical protein
MFDGNRAAGIGCMHKHTQTGYVTALKGCTSMQAAGSLESWEAGSLEFLQSIVDAPGLVRDSEPRSTRAFIDTISLGPTDRMLASVAAQPLHLESFIVCVHKNCLKPLSCTHSLTNHVPDPSCPTSLT